MSTDDGTTALRAVRREAIGVAVATSAYGISFGALAVAAGLDIWQACVLSLVMFTGGSQFAFIGVVASGGLSAVPAAVASAALLGVRNIVYGLRMSPLLPGRAVYRIAAAQMTIDESVAVALAQSTHKSRVAGFWITGVAIYLGWNATTLLGALLGDVLGDVRAYGLDAAAAGAFLALLWPRIQKREPIVVGILAAVVAAAFTPLTAPGIPILLAACVAIVVGLAGRKARTPAGEKNPETQAGEDTP